LGGSTTTGTATTSSANKENIPALTANTLLSHTENYTPLAREAKARRHFFPVNASSGDRDDDNGDVLKYQSKTGKKTAKVVRRRFFPSDDDDSNSVADDDKQDDGDDDDACDSLRSKKSRLRSPSRSSSSTSRHQKDTRDDAFEGADGLSLDKDDEQNLLGSKNSPGDDTTKYFGAEQDDAYNPFFEDEDDQQLNEENEQVGFDAAHEDGETEYFSAQSQQLKEENEQVGFDAHENDGAEYEPTFGSLLRSSFFGQVEEDDRRLVIMNREELIEASRDLDDTPSAHGIGDALYGGLAGDYGGVGEDEEAFGCWFFFFQWILPIALMSLFLPYVGKIVFADDGVASPVDPIVNPIVDLEVAPQQDTEESSDLPYWTKAALCAVISWTAYYV